MHIILSFGSILYLLLIIGSVAATPKYKDCGSKLGTVTDLKISGCTDTPCPLKKGTNVSVTMDFKANADITQARTRVYGYIAGVKLPFTLPDNDACHFMKCPDHKDNEEGFNMELEIKKYYPKVEVIIKWELHNGTVDGEMITCFETEAQIID